jgi:sugar phosphate isomerase/epimerase
MRVIVFTRPFGPVSVAELVGRLGTLGVDGADLTVRDGQTVTPGQPGGIGSVAEALADNGMRLEVVTTDLREPGPIAEGIFDACAESGVSLVRLGFYRYQPEQGYDPDTARRGIAGLAALGAERGVRVALQLHQGTIHPSAAHALRLIDDLDVLVYADFGNQAKEGSEDWRLTLDQLGDRVACVGVKNAAWERTPDGWEVGWVPLADGVVPWQRIIPGLSARGYHGPLSLHVFYPTPDPASAVRRDLEYLRRCGVPTVV